MVITIWYNPKKNQWLHNHISNGYDYELLAPIPQKGNQARSWSNGQWQSHPGKLVQNEVIWDIPNSLKV